MRERYADESFRKNLTLMWKIAKARDLDCVDYLAKVKAQANYDVITARTVGETSNRIAPETYVDLIKQMQRLAKGEDLTRETLFLYGLPARRGTDVQLLHVTDSQPEDSRRNYIVRGDRVRFVWNIQKTDKPSDYYLDELKFLPRYDEIVELINNLPEGPLLDRNYYTSTVELTGMSPTNFRHYWFDTSKRILKHPEWLKVIKCMNTSMAQAVAYCS